MNKTTKEIVVWFICIVVAVGGWFSYKEYKQIRQDHAIEKQDFNTAVALILIRVHQVDRYASDIMAADKGMMRRNAADEASHTAASFSFQFYPSNSPLSNLNASWGFEGFWQNTKRYMQYVSDTSNVGLTELQYKNLDLIRQHLKIWDDYLNRIHTATDIRDESKALDRKKINELIYSAVLEIQTLPNIGADDKSFNDYMYLKNPYNVESKRIFPITKEQTLGENELLERAKYFMGKLWPANAVLTVVGGLERPELGETVQVQALYKGKASANIVEVAKSGGHILNVRLENSPEGAGSFHDAVDMPIGKTSHDEAVTFAKEMIDRWGGESIEVYSIDEKADQITVTFAPKIDDVFLVYRSIDVSIDLQSGRLLSFKGDNYFTEYENIESYPKLTPEEAVSKVSSSLKVSGEPVLMFQNKLLYKIPVSGLDKVNYVYINAITGNYDSMEYEFQSP